MPRSLDHVSRRQFMRRATVTLAAGLVLPFAGRHSARAQRPTSTTVLTREDIEADEPWLDVGLDDQVAIAMRGSEPARVIPVTTGAPRWETPVGQFRIRYRVADEHMTSDALGIPRDSPEGYDLDHVLWTQYFDEEGDALHTNYWQPLSVFGSEPTSHGCVGMLEGDAAFLWQFLGLGSVVNIHA